MNIEFYTGSELSEEIQELISGSICIAPGERAFVINAAHVGASYEPRIRVIYNLRRNEIIEGTYEHTLILNEDRSKFIKIILKNKLNLD